MADETELQDLRERIGRLRLDEQLHLFELVFGDYRRQCEEARASNLADVAAMFEWERSQARAAEGKREAG